MSYYDHATHIALELSSRNRQEHLANWKAERELARQKQNAEEGHTSNSFTLAGRALRICKLIS